MKRKRRIENIENAKKYIDSLTHVPKVVELVISICIEIELLPSVVVFSLFVLVLESLFTFHGLSTQNFRPFRPFRLLTN